MRFIEMIKPKWPPQPRFYSQVKTKNTNRFADPENLYIIPGFDGILKKKRKKNFDYTGTWKA